MFCFHFEFLLNLITLAAFLLLVIKYANFAFKHYLTLCGMSLEECCVQKETYEKSNDVPGLAEGDMESAGSTSVYLSHSDTDRDRDSDCESDVTSESDTLASPGDGGKTAKVVTPSTDDDADLSNTHTLTASSHSLSRHFYLATCDGNSTTEMDVCEGYNKPFRLLSSLTQSERCERQITSVLNKMTLERLEVLYQQLFSICCSEDAGPNIIQTVAREIFAKATVQHTLAKMYAEVCSKLYNDFTAKGKKSEAAVEFKRHLLGQCQRSFSLYLQPPQIDALADEEDRYEQLIKHKTKMLGNMRLIAHLIRHNILASHIVFDCTDELLKVGSDETLESLCTLVSTLGDFFDTPDWSGNVRPLVLYSRMKLLAKDETQSSRIRFLIRNVLDERNGRSERHNSFAAPEIATPAPRGPMLLKRVGSMQGGGLAHESESKKHSDGKKQKKQVNKQDGSAKQMEQSKPEAHQLVEPNMHRATQSGQKGNDDQKPREVEEKLGSSRRRKRNGRRSKVTAQSARESDEKQVAARPADSKSARSTKSSSSNLAACRRKDGERKSICRFFVGIEEDNDFQVCRRLIGPGGENMKRITSAAAEAKIRIRGAGSKYLEGPENEESTDPLMICVSATALPDFENAVSQVEALLEKVHEAYRCYCRSHSLPAPTLTVQRETLRVDAHA